jgi:hypothetical protein
MTRRVDRERSILGIELEEPKLIARGEDGECVENVTHGLLWRLKETLHAWRLGALKRLKRRVGCGGREADPKVALYRYL